MSLKVSKMNAKRYLHNLFNIFCVTFRKEKNLNIKNILYFKYNLPSAHWSILN